MAQQMQSASLEYHYSKRAFHGSTVIDTTGDAVFLPSRGGEVAVAVTPGTSARVEYTLSPFEAVESGSANWLPWPAGDVTEPASDAVIDSVTALRLVSTGESSWEVAA